MSLVKNIKVKVYLFRSNRAIWPISRSHRWYCTSPVPMGDGAVGSDQPSSQKVATVEEEGDKGVKLAAMTLNLSFAGCGFLGIYHLGVVQALAVHGHKLLLNTQRFAGASAGALIAATLAIKGTDQQTINDCVDFCYDLAKEIRRRHLGVLTPKVSLLEPLQEFLETMLPEDAHTIASGRLYISITNRQTKENEVISQFESKEQLVQYMLGSSYIPVLTGRKSVKVHVDGKDLLDGGLTDNLPILPKGRTICVSPFSGNQDICPRDKRGLGLYTTLNKQNFQVNRHNVLRGLHSMRPPKSARMEKYFWCGVNDTIRFLKDEGFYDAGDAGGDGGDGPGAGLCVEQWRSVRRSMSRPRSHTARSSPSSDRRLSSPRSDLAGEDGKSQLGKDSKKQSQADDDGTLAS